MKFFMIGLALLISGCNVPAPPPMAGPDPADPNAPVAKVGRRSTVAPYQSRRPVDPGPWREQNERVAPAPKP
jgi:hypothetical protein